MSQLKKAQLIAFFGEAAGQKLYTLLNNCCDNPCCPGQKYTLSYELSADCNESGRWGLTLTLTSSATLEGVVALSQYIGPQNALEFNSTTVVENIAAGVVLVNNTTMSGGQTTYYVYLDSRGNYSNVIEVTTPECP